MRTVKLLTVGKLKDAWLREGCAEYVKRLGTWAQVQVEELDECRLPAEPSDAQIEAGLRQEGARILQKVPKGACLVALCIEGRRLSSEALADFLEERAVQGEGTLVFCIGSSFGLCEEVKQQARLRLSMSEMTFPHQLARLMLLEQLYRAFSINANSKYHK